jgi:transposase
MQKDKRALVLTRLVAGKLSAEETALLLGISTRQVWRLKSRFVADGPGALVHRNRGKLPANRIDPKLVARVVRLRRERYEGLNDSHFADLLREREGIALSRASVQRLLRAAGIASPRRHRVARYRRRREPRAAAGMLLQLDGSREDWFGTGERQTLQVAIDDATSEVVAATFRAQEDGAGYLEVLAQVLAQKGVPLAVYTDRHGVFFRAPGERETMGEDLAGARQPTQLGRAFAELGVEAILANSPQAKGRVERLFGTLQDRLAAELRLERITTIARANAALPSLLARHNSRFARAAVDPLPAWRALSPSRIEEVCCFKYLRTVAHDNTLQLGSLRLQLAPRAAHWSWAGRRLEARQHLDGGWTVHDEQGRELLRAPATTLGELRAQHYVRAPIPGTALPPEKLHPWRESDGLKRWHPAAARRTLVAARSKGQAI